MPHLQGPAEGRGDDAVLCRYAVVVYDNNNNPAMVGSACDECARNGIIDSEGSRCPVCGDVANPEELIPYRLFRDKVGTIIQTQIIISTILYPRLTSSVTRQGIPRQCAPLPPS